MPLQPGAPAPDIRLTSHDNQTISFTDFRGQQAVVVIFFPLAFSSTCTEEICTIGGDFGEYEALGAQVLAVSVDSPYVLERFREECGVHFPFLSDFHREAARAFGVLRPEPVGRGDLRDTTDRSAFVIDRSGTIVYTWFSKNPSLLPPFEELKRAVQQCQREGAPA